MSKLSTTTQRKHILCTFINLKNLETTVDILRKNISTLVDDIRIYDNFFVRTGVICVYSVIENTEDLNAGYIHENTIKIQRKSYKNTLYTINGLNAIVRRSNNGVISDEYQVDWEIYRDRFLLNVDDGDICDIGMPLELLYIK